MVKIENKNIIENIQNIINTDEIDLNDHFNKIFQMRNDNKASKLLMIKFIEYLMQKWYIERHEKDELFQEISKMDADKHSQRKPKNS